MLDIAVLLPLLKGVACDNALPSSSSRLVVGLGRFSLSCSNRLPPECLRPEALA
jgi:hypothetical protein